MLLDEDDSRSSSRVREHGSSLPVSQLHVAIQDTLKSLSISSRCVNKPMDCPLTSLTILFDLRLRFRLRLCLLSRRSTDTGTQLFTSPPLLDNWVFDLGWVCRDSSLPPATSESNSFRKDSTSKDPFSQCENRQNLLYLSRSSGMYPISASKRCNWSFE